MRDEFHYKVILLSIQMIWRWKCGTPGGDGRVRLRRFQSIVCRVCQYMVMIEGASSEASGTCLVIHHYYVSCVLECKEEESE